MKTPYLLFVEPIFQLIKENEFTVNELEKFNNDLLMKRPDEKRWSIAENIAHLNIAGNDYLGQMLKHKDNFHRSANNDTKKVRSSWYAQYFAKSMLPDRNQKRRFKMKTFAKFEDFGRIDPREEIEKFKLLQSQMKMILSEAGAEDLGKIKIITALGPLLKFRMGDALYFVCSHNKRHMSQIQQTLEIVK